MWAQPGIFASVWSLIVGAVAGTLAGVLPDGPTDIVSADLAQEIEEAGPGEELLLIARTSEPMGDGHDLVEALGGRLVWAYDLLPGFAAYVPAERIRDLTDDPRVLGLSPSRPVAPLMDVSAKAIQAPSAWNAGYDGSGITVAVIDTGVDLFEPSLSGAVVDCVSTIAGVESPECTDTNGHGTHVAGTVASRHGTYRGVAPGASLAIVRVLHAAGAGTSADIIAGMEWVADNKDRVSPPIRVATMSIGFVDPGCGDGRDPEAIAADNLVRRGVVFTIAAGNSGHKTCTVDGASAAFDVITVGASDDRGTVAGSDDTLADFSSGGPTADGRLKPELVAPGVGITSLFVGPFIATLDGTSMATPHAAGAAALLLHKEPGLAPDDVKTRLTATTVAPDAATGLPNNDWGHGLVNACRALQLAGC